MIDVFLLSVALAAPMLGGRADAVNNVIAHTDRRGIATTTTYDGENRPLVLARDGDRRETRSYDAAGRKTAERRPLGFERTWTYHPWGGVHVATDADGLATTHAYDVRQRLTAQTDGAGQTTEHAYDGVGNRLRTQRPEHANSPWRYAYDAADRLERVTSPEGRRWGASGTRARSYTIDRDDRLAAVDEAATDDNLA